MPAKLKSKRLEAEHNVIMRETNFYMPTKFKLNISVGHNVKREVNFKIAHLGSKLHVSKQGTIKLRSKIKTAHKATKTNVISRA